MTWIHRRDMPLMANRPERPELQSVSSIYNEAGEPMMSGEAFRFEQQLDMQAQDDWDAGCYDDYYD